VDLHFGIAPGALNIDEVQAADVANLACIRVAGAKRLLEIG